MVLGIGGGIPRNRVVGPGPHPTHPVGTVPGVRNPLPQARARARAQGTVLARRPPVGVGASIRISGSGRGRIRSGCGTRATGSGRVGQSRSGGVAIGETSRVGAVGFPFPAAIAGRLFHPINSSI